MLPLIAAHASIVGVAYAVSRVGVAEREAKRMRKIGDCTGTPSAVAAACIARAVLAVRAIWEKAHHLCNAHMRCRAYSDWACRSCSRSRSTRCHTRKSRPDRSGRAHCSDMLAQAKRNSQALAETRPKSTHMHCRTCRSGSCSDCQRIYHNSRRKSEPHNYTLPEN